MLEMLPDFKAVLNEPDEPRVLIPHSELHGQQSNHRGLPNVRHSQHTAWLSLIAKHFPIHSASGATHLNIEDLNIPRYYSSKLCILPGCLAGYNESMDVPWEQKNDTVYWRGSNTGGHWTRGSWKMGHRQRFVNFTNFSEAEILILQKTHERKWMAYTVKMSEQQQKFDVKLTGFIQCDEQDCKD
jgi:hypothetical protein